MQIFMEAKSELTYKHLSFVLLILQNTALGIASKYSRIASLEKYRPSTVIFIVEIVKFIISLAVLVKLRCGDVEAVARVLRVEVFGDVKGLQKVAVLAFLYAVQNSLALIAYDFIDVATYQIVYQLKILTTAVFMMVLLNRSFSSIQWGAMLMLMLGVTLCSCTRTSSIESTQSQHYFFGISIVLFLAVNSGLAAAYFERVMKSHQAHATSHTVDSLWVRNLQLSFASVLVTAIDLLRSASSIRQLGLFYGINKSVWIVIFLQAFGGLVVAAVVRYSDNVVKNFGASLSLVLSCFISNILFHQQVAPAYYLGVLMVFCSVCIYGDTSILKRSISGSLMHENKSHALVSGVLRPRKRSFTVC